MTLRQLRELKDFVLRLCKTRLLRNPISGFGRVKGQKILWTQINQYDICEQIMTRIIQDDENSCSWVELVANGKIQSPKTFISHWWGEFFRDFMLSLEHHARLHNIKDDDGYYFCVCANNQWKVELGASLEMSPFFLALRLSSMTLVMMDRMGTIRTRSWCVFEWNETLGLKTHTIQVATTLGLVGAGLVSGGPLVDYLKGLHTAEAKASNNIDQRKIMNRIAGVDESSGISRDAHGKDILTGENYEEELVANHKSNFQALDDNVRAHTLPPEVL